MDPLASILTKLRKVLRHRGQSADEADEVIQEAFLRLQTYRQARPVLEPEAFLVRTVINLSIDAQRRHNQLERHTSAESEILSLVDPNPTPEDVLASEQRLQRLRAGIEGLRSRSREVLILKRIEGFSHAQIAKHLGISVSAVDQHLAKAALFLTEWMDRA